MNAVPFGRPVFILGYARSGTTLALNILMASNEFPKHRFSETHFYSHYFRRFGDITDSGNRDAFLTAVLESDWGREIGLERAALENAVGAEGNYHAVLRLAMRRACEAQSKQRWMEKTPWHGLYVDEILQGFPDAMFIHLVRDPRAVLASLRKIGWGVRGRIGLAKAASAWRYHIDRIERSIATRKVDGITIRYEDLIVSLARELDRIHKFLNVDIDMSDINQNASGVLVRSNSSYSSDTQGISSAPLERWRTEFDPEEVKLIDQVVGRSAQALGYETGTHGKAEFPSSLLGIAIPSAYYLQKTARRVAFPRVRK